MAWPTIFDAVVDYYGRKKLAYRAIRRVQTDVYVMVGEPDLAGRHAVLAVNDSPDAVVGHVRMNDSDGERILIESDFNLAANGDTECLGTTDSQCDVPALCGIEWTLADQPGTVGRNHYPAGSRPFDLSFYRRWLKQHLFPEVADDASHQRNEAMAS